MFNNWICPSPPTSHSSHPTSITLLPSRLPTPTPDSIVNRSFFLHSGKCFSHSRPNGLLYMYSHFSSRPRPIRFTNVKPPLVLPFPGLALFDSPHCEEPTRLIWLNKQRPLSFPDDNMTYTPPPHHHLTNGRRSLSCIIPPNSPLSHPSLSI